MQCCEGERFELHDTDRWFALIVSLFSFNIIDALTTLYAVHILKIPRELNPFFIATAANLAMKLLSPMVFYICWLFVMYVTKVVEEAAPEQRRQWFRYFFR